MSSRTVLIPIVVASFVISLGVACEAEQLRAVKRFNEEAEPIQVACLDFNGDRAVNADDADPSTLVDITGDGEVNDADVSLLRSVDFGLPNGRPECEGAEGAETDWQVSEPPELDCGAGDRGVLLLAIGGGAVDLKDPESAAGVRWMVEEIASDLDVPTQMASIAPSLGSTAEPQPYAEQWTAAFVSQRLREQPCLKVSMFGHSLGGSTATAVAADLEAQGFADQILLTGLIDRVTVGHSGSQSIPQSSPVFNAWLPAPDRGVAGHEIEQANVENFSVEGLEAPEDGEEGGEMVPITHTNIDNSEDVLRELKNRIELLTQAPEW
jgi:hypothetical protein